MEDLIKEAKKEYAKKQYRKNPNSQKEANNRYWRNKAIQYFGKDNITDNDIAKVRNMYYKKYRDANKDKIEKANNNFWNKQVKGE